jgi:hypothetical protein
MAKVLQIKISKDEVIDAVRRYIEHKVAETCKKQKINEQIEEEVEQATIEVSVPDYDLRLKALELAVAELIGWREKNGKEKR